MHHFAHIITIVFLLSGAAHGEPLRVVTDIPAVHSLVSSVTGTLGSPALLLSGASDPHNLQLRPSQVRDLANADLVFWVGPELTPWLERALENTSEDVTATALLSAANTDLLQTEGGVDPHAWLKISNAIVWLEAIATALSNADPANEQHYWENATVAAKMLAEIQVTATEVLRNARGQELFFSHDAFGYFADSFGLQIAGVISPSNGSNPGASHLADIRDLFKTGNIACAFSENGEDSRFLHNLASANDVQVRQLDPVGMQLEPGPKLYPKLIQKLASEIAACVSG